MYPVSTYIASKLPLTALAAKTAATVESTPPDAAIIALSDNSVFNFAIASLVNFSGLKKAMFLQLERAIVLYGYKSYLVGL